MTVKSMRQALNSSSSSSPSQSSPSSLTGSFNAHSKYNHHHHHNHNHHFSTTNNNNNNSSSSNNNSLTSVSSIPANQLRAHVNKVDADEITDLEELEQFAKTFKQRRIKLGKFFVCLSFFLTKQNPEKKMTNVVFLPLNRFHTR